MSFEQQQARLIKELADAQAETRERYRLAARTKPAADDKADLPTAAKRSKD